MAFRPTLADFSPHESRDDSPEYTYNCCNDYGARMLMVKRAGGCHASHLSRSFYGRSDCATGSGSAAQLLIRRHRLSYPQRLGTLQRPASRVKSVGRLRHSLPDRLRADLSEREYRTKVAELVREIEEEGLRVRDGDPVAGVEKILSQNPYQPSKRRPKKSPKPLFHVKSCEARDELCDELKEPVSRRALSASVGLHGLAGSTASVGAADAPAEYRREEGGRARADPHRRASGEDLADRAAGSGSSADSRLWRPARRPPTIRRRHR
jgi:hypothetical protein